MRVSVVDAKVIGLVIVLHVQKLFRIRLHVFGVGAKGIGHRNVSHERALKTRDEL